MHRTKTMLLWVLLVAAGGTAGAAEPVGVEAAPPAEGMAFTHEDGTTLVMVGDAEPEPGGEFRAFDLAGASPELRRRVLADLRAGLYDGVFLGPRTAGDDEGGACGNISRCAREIAQVCRWFGASGTSASIRGGCSGSCSDGSHITVLCATP